MEPKDRNNRFKITIIAMAVLFLFLAFSSIRMGSFAAQFPFINRIVNVFNNQDKTSVTREVIQIPITKSKHSIIVSLNEQFVNQGKENYQKAAKEIGLTSSGEMKESPAYHRLLDDKQFLVLHKNPDISQTGSFSDSDYLVIDKQSKVVLTLPMLFKGDEYKSVIRNEIFRQIQVLMEQNQGYHYYSQEQLEKRGINPETLITQDSTFYINDEHQVVIVIPRYLLTSHNEGKSEFVIPEKAIESLLINSSYFHKS